MSTHIMHWGLGWLAIASIVDLGSAEAAHNVRSIADLMAVGNANDNFGTGIRTTRNIFLSFQGSAGKNGKEVCAPELRQLGLEYYLQYPDLYAVGVVDVDGEVSDDLLAAFGVSRESLVDPCGQMGAIVRRSKEDALKVLHYVPHWPLPPGHFDQQASDWLLSSQACSLELVNELDEDLEILWSHSGSQFLPAMDRKLRRGSSQWMNTYATTTLIARPVGSDKEVDRHFVRGSGMFVIAPTNVSTETCGELGAPEVEPWTEEEIAAREAADLDRLTRNRVDPARLPKFTPTGFMKSRVPEEVWDMISTYYHDNKADMRLESWQRDNVYTNNHETPSYMVPVPTADSPGEAGQIRNAILEGMRPVLEAWTDNLELRFTSMYGIRVYRNDSWLANHIDTRDTHVISAIINVDQDVVEDWPLEIYDHDGGLHHVLMQPGDMVLYESAVCVHGRPTRLNGKYFANLFIHYKPTDPTKWPL